MLLAPQAGRAAARDRRAARGGAARAARRAGREGRGRRPGFLNVFLADAWYTAAAAHILAAGDDWGGGTAGDARADRDRVRLRQPDRPADRGQRPPRRVRRRAGAAARVRRPRGLARVLLQRRRRAGAIRLGRVDPAPRPRRAGAGGRLPGRVRGRAGGRARGRRRARRRGPRVRRRAPDDRADQGDARALPRPLRHLVLRSARLHDGGDRARVRARPATTPTGPRARCGCGPPTSATTRTA